MSSNEDLPGKSSNTLTRSTSAGTALSGNKSKPVVDGNRLDSKQTSHGRLEEEEGMSKVKPWATEDSLETNVLEESTGRLDIVKVVNNLDKFVLGCFLISFLNIFFLFRPMPEELDDEMSNNERQERNGRPLTIDTLHILF